MRRPVLAGLLLFATGTAVAQSCLDPGSENAERACFEAARECVSIKPDDERLACFDRAYAVESLTTPALADSESATPVELIATPEEYAQRSSGRATDDRIESTIVGITTNAHNIDFLRLDNGHIWRENEDSRVRFSMGSKVTIEEGMFGSFNLKMEGAPRAVKVRRVE